MGKKYTTILTLFAIICVLFAGCEQDERHATGYGTMNIRLSANSSMIEVGRSSDTRSHSTDQQSMIATTRTEEAPEASSFSLSLSNEKAEVKHWNSYADFKEEEKIAIGNYTLKAYYGDEKKEGFNAAYYEGSTNIQILENQNSTAEITCYVANVQLTVVCSEAVQKYFTTFEMQARSSKGTAIDIAKDDQRPVYLKPGSLQLEAKVKKQNGIGQTLRLLDIDETQARQHYIIQVDVNGGDTGSGTLNVTYNTVQSEEVVTIDISDASLNLKAPEFTAQGFDNGQTITLREGSQPESMKVTLNARAGIRECDLLIESPYLNSEAVGIDGLVKLVPTSDAAKAMKQKVVDKGLRLLGLEDEKIERLALIDFTQLVMNMVCTGDHDESSKFTLRAVDKRGVVHETDLSFTTTLQSNQFSLPAITKTVMIGSTEAEAEVNLLTSGNTGEQDVNNVIFEYKNEANEWVEATTEWVGDNTEEIKNHTVKIKKLPEVHRNLTVRARYGSKISEEQILSYYIPEFTITANPADIWPRKATIQVRANTLEEQKAILKYFKLTYNGKDIVMNNNLSTITNLIPGETYNIVGICNSEGELQKDYTFKLQTEIPIQLPNSTFKEKDESGSEPWSLSYNKKINQGGFHSWSNPSGWGGSYYTAQISTYEPKGWSSVNLKTMPTQSPSTLCENTWFIVPSTERVSDSNTPPYGVKIRSVAWDNSGNEPKRLTSTNWSRPSLNELNAPEQIKYYSAGRFFLGDYSFNHTGDMNNIDECERYNEGIEFTSRPIAISFYYQYKSYPSSGQDKGYIKISVENRTNGVTTILTKGEKELEDKDGYGKATVPLEKYPDPCLKATHICVMFCSSIGGINKKQSEETLYTIKTSTPANSKSVAYCSGSELYIDDIELIY